jgi:hypothetical protein
VRSKNLEIKRHINGTGGGGPSKKILSELEVKLLLLLGIAGVDGISGVKEGGFPPAVAEIFVSIFVYCLFT